MEELSMKEMLEQIDKSMQPIHSGDIVKGSVISVNDDGVMVNIGYMSDGLIPREELTNNKEVNPSDIVKVNDEIYVYILKVNDGEGNVLLSKKKADALKIWDKFEESFKSGAAFSITVDEVVKGGVVSNIEGARAFMPASQISIARVENLEEYVGKTMLARVIELDKEKRKIVLSRRAIEEEEREIKKGKVWDTLRKGEKRKGTVSRITKFGAFVDLGGIDGLIHLSDLSWKRVVNAEDVVSVGDIVEIYVLDFDKAKGRISLGLKEISDDPWNNISSKYKVDNIVEGTVSKLMNFGAFVELEAGVEGLVHLSEISEDRIVKASDVLTIGAKVKVKVLDVNEKDKRISLSIKDAVDKVEEDFSMYNDKEDDVTLADLFKDKLKGFKFEE